MSVLIKGMEMPKDCEHCGLSKTDSAGFFGCSITENIVLRKREENRPSWCPLIEVPTPHGRLIDADALKGEMIRTYEYEFPTATGAIDEFATRILPNIINNASTIIEAEEGEDE